ncbi:Activator of stress genes protein 1 [Candida albicans SC5314] [Rhizoctonia solani]|uniref:Activator of stress genes protein 1 [Candida albicans SC5314] n=1 Tax=Rhizoctonia solani TaxID=456999 RepID=A0A0K6GGH7_9AGAM|nr:Activator of stress genes protein 1 [Candida albicans SC5314] [Rhizoctonia solani]
MASRFTNHYHLTTTHHLPAPTPQQPPLLYDYTQMAISSKKQRIDDSTLPPDLGLKPVQLQRRRVWRACEGCRRKKIKCDGREPTCSQCSLTGNTCTWIQTKDRAALSRHYVQELEARLLHMESLLGNNGIVIDPASRPDTVSRPASAAAGASANAVTVVSSTAPPRPHSAAGSVPGSPESTLSTEDELFEASVPRIKKEDDEENVADQFGQLALDGHGQLRWIGGSSTMSLIEAFHSMSADPGATPPPASKTPRLNVLYFPPSVIPGKLSALPGAEEVEYPERDLADKLVDAYFEKFHHTMPCIDKLSFLANYKKLMDDNGANSYPGFTSLVFAVFAVAARILIDPRIVRPPPFGALDSVDETIRPTALIFYERSMMLYYIGQTVTQLAHVQTFVLLSSFLASINCLPQAWLLCGQAVRTGQDLGLHRSPEHCTSPPWTKKPGGGHGGVFTDLTGCSRWRSEGRSASTMRIATKPVDRSSPSLMYGFIALTTLYKIAGKVLRSVYALDKCKGHLRVEKLAELQASVDRLDSQLNAWCEELPDCFKSHPSTPKQVSLGAILCSTYYAILITLHRNFLPTRRNVRLSWNPSSHSVGKAVGAARSCIFLAQSIKDVIPRSHCIAFFIQFLFSAAVIVLLCLMHATDEGAAQTALAEVDSCLTCLESLEDAWPGARRCKELLEDLQTAAKETMKNIRARRVANLAAGPSGTRDASPVVSEHLRKTHRAGSASLSESRGVLINGRSGHHVSRSMSAPKRARADSTEEAPSHPVLKRVVTDRATPGSAVSSPTVDTFNTSQLQSFATPSEAFGGSHAGPVRAGSTDPLFGTPSPAFDSINDFTHSMDFIHTGPATDLGMSSSPVFSSFDHSAGMFSAGPSWTTPRTTADGTGAASSSNELANFMQYGIYDSPGSNGATPPPADPFDVSGLPFSGLEGFLSSFAPGSTATSGDIMDSLWSNYKGPAGSDVRFDLGMNGTLVDAPDALG